MMTLSEKMQMVKSQIDIKQYAESHLQRAKHGHRYVCPFCGSGDGSHPNSDSGFSLFPKGREESFKCMSCRTRGDIYDLCALVESINPDNKPEQLERVAQFFGIAIPDDNDNHCYSKLPSAQSKKSANKQRSSIMNNSSNENETIKLNRVKATRQLKIYQQALTSESNGAQKAREYLLSRGFTLEQAQTRGLGYDASVDALVIPYIGFEYYYTKRRINEGNRNKYIKPKSADVGAQPLYNEQALKNNSYIIAVEGEMDAVALECEGFDNVIALGGTQGINALISALIALKMQNKDNAQYRLPTTLLFFDADKKGQQAQEETALKMESENLPYIEVNLPIKGKDPNEMRQNQTYENQLKEEISKLINADKHKQAEVVLDKYSKEGLKNSLTTVSNLYDLKDSTEPIPTGIRKLDSYLWGGLDACLCVLGATSSIGKTSLTVQIADYIAQSGYPVLFVTIEQSERELTAKSLSRISYNLLQGQNDRYIEDNALKHYEILHKSARQNGNVKWNKYNHFAEVCEYYSQKIAPNMHYFASNYQPSTKVIADIAKAYAQIHGRTPVIFIDYLQLLAPQSERDSDKQAVDRNVTALRQMARDLKTPIFTISSLNRASYSGVVDLAAFKESGAIEYGADVLLGLQPAKLEEELKCVKSETEQKKYAKHVFDEFADKTKRDCVLTLLKNRSGSTYKKGFSLEFDTVFSRFTQM